MDCEKPALKDLLYTQQIYGKASTQPTESNQTHKLTFHISLAKHVLLDWPYVTVGTSYASGLALCHCGYKLCYWTGPMSLWVQAMLLDVRILHGDELHRPHSSWRRVAPSAFFMETCCTVRILHGDKLHRPHSSWRHVAPSAFFMETCCTVRILHGDMLHRPAQLQSC
jgi:hypothetical protein